MEWYWIVLITAVGFWAVSIFLAQFNEDYTLYWACGLLYPIVYLLMYPLRAISKYDNHRAYYLKHGISMFKYVFVNMNLVGRCDERNRKGYSRV